MRRLIQWPILFVLPLALSSSVAPDMVERQDLPAGRSIAQAREGTYTVRNVSLRRTSNDYAEFVREGGKAFWAKVPSRVEIPEGKLTITILKQGDFYKLKEVKSLNYQKQAFDYLGLQNGQPTIEVAGDIKSVNAIPECSSGQAAINEQGKIGRLICPNSSSGSASASQ